MLIPRVTAALIKFLAPVSSTGLDTLERQRVDQNTKQNTRQNSKERQPKENTKEDSKSKGQNLLGKQQGRPALKLVQNAPAKKAPKSTPDRPPPENELSKTSSTASSAFLQLMTDFRSKRGSLQEKTGTAAYKASVRDQKRGLFKKGAILDTKIE